MIVGISNIRHFGSITSSSGRKWGMCRFIHKEGWRRTIACSSASSAMINNNAQRDKEQLLVVVGGGAAGVYAAIQAKKLAPFLNVIVVEKGRLLSKVKVSGGGRCNVTNGHYVEKIHLIDHYPRGNRELRGSFFDFHGPLDTMSWFQNHGVELQTEKDGRVFPVSNSSSSIVDCLLHEAKKNGVLLQIGKVVTSASCNVNGKFLVKIEKRTADFVEIVETDYLLIATGSSKQGHALAVQLGHSIVDPIPSLFTFKIEDGQLTDLSGITFPNVKVKLILDATKSIPQFTQVGPMLVTHWGLSGPVILRLSAWGARNLFHSNYIGTLLVDFMPGIPTDDVKNSLFQHRDRFGKHKLSTSFPPSFDIFKRFWKYLFSREGLDGDLLWASISNKSLNGLTNLLKQCDFKIKGKGQFKDEFVTAGGIPLSEVLLETMESRKQAHLFFAGEVLNVDGVTGGFNFQNAWSGGYIAGTSIGKLSSENYLRMQALAGPITI
ncbi:hypothetical protein ZOSMA_41G00920 [Zostera marina]|uniref:FAD/NAD(P)-binding oxidoreductase family protein n=1 Tax=Zostera marina TaxID=29655 RepID=A0A0K9P2Q0_ZOSMR|nr:hypothetical protein ZOSMA_41G00920 [Zostera marina]